MIKAFTEPEDYMGDRAMITLLVTKRGKGGATIHFECAPSPGGKFAEVGTHYCGLKWRCEDVDTGENAMRKMRCPRCFAPAVDLDLAETEEAAPSPENALRPIHVPYQWGCPKCGCLLFQAISGVGVSLSETSCLNCPNPACTYAFEGKLL